MGRMLLSESEPCMENGAERVISVSKSGAEELLNVVKNVNELHIGYQWFLVCV